MKAKTKWSLFLIISRNPNIKTKELISMGFNPQTVRRYRKYYQHAEKELLGLNK